MVKLEDILNLPEVYAKGTPFSPVFSSWLMKPFLILFLRVAQMEVWMVSELVGKDLSSLIYFLQMTLFSFSKLPLLANCGRLDILLKWYCIASGQLINLDKSNIFFSPNVPSALRIGICDVLNIQPAVNLGK